jgi:hypothetical protein
MRAPIMADHIGASANTGLLRQAVSQGRGGPGDTQDANVTGILFHRVHQQSLPCSGHFARTSRARAILQAPAARRDCSGGLFDGPSPDRSG